jgi:hypothetical protein
MEKDMQEKRVLIYDRRNSFFRMFRKKIKEEFGFCENILTNDGDISNYNDYLILVLYNKMDLADFSKLCKRRNVLVCVFDSNLYLSLIFQEEFKNVFLLNGTKSKSELLEDLRIYFKLNKEEQRIHKLQLQ